MNEQQLLYYISTHGGQALIGSQETLISALKLEKAGKVRFLGREGGNYRYGLTADGAAAVRAPNKVRVVRAAATAGRAAGRAVQTYATAFKDEQRAQPRIVERRPRGADVGYVADIPGVGVGGEGYLGIDPSEYPGLQYASRQQAPMRQVPQVKRKIPAKPAPAKKGAGFIIVNGKRYRRVG